MTDDTRAWLAQALAQALAASADPGCRARLGPIVPGATLAGGARVPGLPHELDPPQAAFNLALMLLWPVPPGDPGDPQPSVGDAEASMVAALLAAADWRGRSARRLARAVPTLADFLAEIAACRAGLAQPRADFDALALRGVVTLLGGDAADASRARLLLPQPDEPGGDPLWRSAARAGGWLRAALYVLRGGPALEQRWPASPPSPWPGRLEQRGRALLRRMADDATLDPMPLDLWLSYLVDT
jgi:hypothetical protein